MKKYVKKVIYFFLITIFIPFQIFGFSKSNFENALKNNNTKELSIELKSLVNLFKDDQKAAIDIYQ